MLVANIKIWKSHLNIREGSDYSKCYRKVATCKIRRIQKIIEGEEELQSSIILFVQNGIKKMVK